MFTGMLGAEKYPERVNIDVANTDVATKLSTLLLDIKHYFNTRSFDRVHLTGTAHSVK